MTFLPTEAVNGWGYTPLSRLLVQNADTRQCYTAFVNPSDTPDYSVYYEWTGRAFVARDSVPLLCFDQRSN